jgi:hypothetical protein
MRETLSKINSAGYTLKDKSTDVMPVAGLPTDACTG